MGTIFDKEIEMLNREIKVDLVKKGKSQEIETDQLKMTFNEKAEVISDIVGENIKKIGVAVCVYVLLDTVRKVAVASVTH
jgi:tartrate dehydratase alpha subunit/fumarate hydratase class I-like protein